MGRYSLMKTRLTEIKNTGYDYRGHILLRTTNPNLYKNPVLNGFAEKIEEVLNEWFYQVKSIKKFFNYIVPPDSDDIN